MTNNFNILVNKLNAFRLRYYSVKLMKGLVLTIFLILIVFTVFSLVEYFVFLSSEVRKILFYGFLIFAGLLTAHFIVIPVLRLFHVLKPIDIKASSSIIQNHFTDIKDKLLNVIELTEIDDPSFSSDIVFASIDQKIKELSIFDFSKAVEYKNLRLVLIYFLISILITSTLFFVNRSIFLSASQRIIHYNTQYIKPAPYEYILKNSELTAKKGDAFKVLLECTGDELPQLVYINIEGNNYLMKKSSTGLFEFEMPSVIQPITFYFTDLKYNSDEYYLKVLPKPGIQQFHVTVNPPVYTGLPVIQHTNVGDLQIPNGTQVEWYFQGMDIDTLYMSFNDSVSAGATNKESGFEIKNNFYQSTDYHIFIKNMITEPELALSYRLDVIPDLFPEIKIVSIQDSMLMTRFFFKGSIGDDYGFTGLHFHFNINETDSAISIPFIKSLTDQEFYFSFDFNEVVPSSGLVSYYFSVTDNDIVNNLKTTTSDNFVFVIPDKKEIAESEKEQFKKLEEFLGKSERLAQEIQKDLQNLRLKNMDTNFSDWEKTQMVNDILSKQNQLENLHEQIKKNNEILNNFQNTFNEQNDEIKTKQQQIEQLMEEVFTDELKKLLEEFEKLANQFNQENLNQLSEKLDLTYDDLQKQLDRNLEMLRKMKVEQKFQHIIDDLSRVAGEQEEMAEEILDKSDLDEMLNKLDNQQDDLDGLQNALKEALEMNEQLDKPLNFDDFDIEFNDIKESMEKSRNELQNKNRKRSNSGLNETSEKIRNTAFAMQQMLNSNKTEQNLENLQDLRQILSNLMYISFEQEEVLSRLSEIEFSDPDVQDYHLKQRKIKDQSQIVKDSLYALAKRTPQINSMVNNELIVMELHLEKALDQLSEGLIPNAGVSQQYVMTAANNLALLLNEALETLENQMAEGQSGDQNCEKPGQGKPGMSMLKQQSENLKQQLQQMIEQMKSGNPQQMSQQIGQSLMQHEMMQQMLREIMNDGNVGSEARDALQKIDDMLEQNRKQLLNKNVNAEMIARQNEITSRLLEAEKAELEREFEDERESKTADDFYSNPVEFFEYGKREDSTLEFFNRNSHKLNNFYNNKYKQYLNRIQTE
ncbi:MAG: hypothetical protein PHV35_00335 [Mariniphaga sp.]|nr:hypothetical protein [Mariniphaga sp.]